MRYFRGVRSRAYLAKAVLVLTVVLSAGGVHGHAKTEGQPGSLYIQTNEINNFIIRYARKSNGKLVEIERVATGGQGSGTFKPITGQESAPNAFEGVGSVILSPDHRYLFTTNGGNNSVSSFRVERNGALKLLDVQPTGQPVTGRSGTAKSLAYSPKTNVLYVAHSFGPDHIRMFNVKRGKLEQKNGQHTVNTQTKTDRIPTQIVLTPDGKFLMADILFDRRPKTNADGSADLAVANVDDKDGLVIFPVKNDGGLGEPRFTDGGGAAPFTIAFLNNSKDTFVNGLAAAGGLVLGKIDSDGRVTNSPVVQINQSQGGPTELCWISITPDNKQVFATIFGYSYVSSYKIKDGVLQVAKDPAALTVPGDGTFRALNSLVSSGPSDSWISSDGRYFYQIYPNASKLVAYKIEKGARQGEDDEDDEDSKREGFLTQIDVQEIPYTSPQGMVGF